MGGLESEKLDLHSFNQYSCSIDWRWWRWWRLIIHFAPCRRISLLILTNRSCEWILTYLQRSVPLLTDPLDRDQICDWVGCFPNCGSGTSVGPLSIQMIKQSKSYRQRLAAAGFTTYQEGEQQDRNQKSSSGFKNKVNIFRKSHLSRKKVYNKVK